MCPWHGSRYHRDKRPGRARLPSSWWHRYEQFGRPVPIDYADEAAFRRWCATTPAPWWPGQINLRGLRPLVRAEIKWGLFIHTQRARPTRWDLGWIRSLVATCRDHDVETLIGFPLGAGGSAYFTGAIVKEILHELRLVYFTPAETKDAGFIETDHFGVRFDQRASHVDLTGIPQRWLRDLVWDYLAALLQSPRCPRSGGVIDGIRRAAIELGAFLEIDAPGGGHDPTVLDGEHMRRFVADQRRRERDGLPSLAIKQPGGKTSIVTTVTRSIVFNALHKMLRDALDTGAADRIGLAREFIVAVPTAGATTGRTPRRPFPDEVARALADETNLRRLAEVYDPQDRGLRDMWEITVTTGRRIGEVLQVRWDCLGRYGGLPMFWHDQTKVGNYDAAIRIPERLHDVIAERQRKTLERFIAQHGRRPTGDERAGLALFPTTHRNHDGSVALTYQWFHSRFRDWIAELDLGHCVPHQARHTLATNLLRAGASLTHIRRYLGQVSDRMAEHYVHLSNSDLEDVLQQVWVAGPGTANPGELLTSDTVPDDPRAGPSAGDRPVAAQHAGRGRLLHLPAGRRRWGLPVESGLPQLRQVRALRRGSAVLAAQTRAMATTGRGRPRRRHRRLPAPLLRAHRPRHRRPGKSTGRPRAPRIRRSPWTCASRRTTSTGCGPPRSAPPILPTPPAPPTTTTATITDDEQEACA